MMADFDSSLLTKYIKYLEGGVCMFEFSDLIGLGMLAVNIISLILCYKNK